MKRGSVYSMIPMWLPLAVKALQALASFLT